MVSTRTGMFAGKHILLLERKNVHPCNQLNKRITMVATYKYSNSIANEAIYHSIFRSICLTELAASEVDLNLLGCFSKNSTEVAQYCAIGVLFTFAFYTFATNPCQKGNSQQLHRTKNVDAVPVPVSGEPLGQAQFWASQNSV